MEHPSPISLYVHIPFCLSRCGYCVFASGPYDESLADAYIAAVEKEVRRHEYIFSDARPFTLFIGGGTPSCLTPRQLRTLLHALPFPGKGGEATCELNPDSTTSEKLHILREAGISRCSFGVQTFSDKGLTFLQRRHTALQAEKALQLASDTGFTSLSLDIMNGWPGQGLEEHLEDLRRAVQLKIHHISNYNFILESDARHYAEYAQCAAGDPDDDGDRALWDSGEQLLARHGFIHYETSNFAREGHECKHNTHIWRGGDYVGVGLGAHSHTDDRRYANTTDLRQYLSCMEKGETPEVYSERLGTVEKARECAVFWLRLFEGIHLESFTERTGHTLESLYGDTLSEMLSRGLLQYNSDRSKIRVPREYQPILDAILIELI